MKCYSIESEIKDGFQLLKSALLGVLLIMLSCSSEEDNKIELLYSLSNKTIEFATYIPEGSSFISIGRKIKIIGPEEAIRITQQGEQMIPELIKLLYDEERDWAANVILSSITGRDALMVSVYADNYQKWKKTKKKRDVRYWENWWKENKIESGPI